MGMDSQDFHWIVNFSEDEIIFSKYIYATISHFFLINLFTYIGAFACCSLTECPAKFTVHIIPSRPSNTLTGLHTKYIYSINSSGHMYYLANSLTLTLMTHTYIV